MATKLKKLTRSALLKAIAFILIIACSFIFILSIYNVKDVEYFESILQPDFMQSEELGYAYYTPINHILKMLKYSNNEANYNQYKEYLNKYKGMYYYASDGMDEVKNISNNPEKNFFERFPTYLYIDNYNFDVKPNTNNLTNYVVNYINSSMLDYETKSDFKLYIGLTDEFLNPIINKWNQDRALLLYEFSIMAISFIIALLSFIYLVATTGKKGEEEGVHLNLIDKLYTDINLVVIAIVAGLGISAFYEWFYYYSYESYMQKYFAATLCAVVVGVTLTFGLSLIRHIKNHTLIKHSLSYTIVHTLYKMFSGIFLSGPLMLKAMLVLTVFTIACIVGTIAFPLIIFVFAFGVYFVYINIKKFKLIRYGVKSIQVGDVGYKMSINGNGELAKLANDINSIADGLDKAVKNEIKSQKMKTELITNVSHDIKTPLTSIINYVDLLKKEGLNSENANKYLDILDQKSQRLKVLTEDLFEAAKASSGDMPVELGQVEIHSLVQQGLAELEDRIKESGLDFKVNIPREKVYVLADGKLLWRVVENLLSNVFKYALRGSRVYIDIIDANNVDNIISLTIKNISSYELNIDVDELMERFKRADESRSSEGSGLGLAIAKDLMEIQNGSLNLEIDGDLFKATIMIPKFK